jgi:hypothetical protein
MLIVGKTFSLKTLHQKKKRAGGVAQGVGPEFKPQYRQKTNKKTPTPSPYISMKLVLTKTAYLTSRGLIPRFANKSLYRLRVWFKW